MKKYLIILPVIIILFIGSGCGEKRNCHVADFLHPAYCTWQVHWVIPIGSIEFAGMLDSDINIKFSLPNWLYFDNIGGFTTISFGIVDKYEKAKVDQIMLEVKSFNESNTITIKILPTEFDKNLIRNLLSQAKIGSEVSISFSLKLGDLHLYTREEYAYNDFEVPIMIFVNNSLIDLYILRTNIAELLSGYLRSTLNELPDNSFSGNPQEKKDALFNKIDALENMINAKNPQGAYQKLKNDIMSKFDGQNGGNPQDDWISDPYYASATYSFYNKILNLLDYLKS